MGTLLAVLVPSQLAASTWVPMGSLTPSSRLASGQRQCQGVVTVLAASAVPVEVAPTAFPVPCWVSAGSGTASIPVSGQPPLVLETHFSQGWLCTLLLAQLCGTAPWVCELLRGAGSRGSLLCPDVREWTVCAAA